MRSRADVCSRSSRQFEFAEDGGGTTSRRSCEVVSWTMSSPDRKLETASMSYTCVRRSPARPHRFDGVQSLRSGLADADKRARRSRCLRLARILSAQRTAQKAKAAADNDV